MSTFPSLSTKVQSFSKSSDVLEAITSTKNYSHYDKRQNRWLVFSPLLNWLSIQRQFLSLGECFVLVFCATKRSMLSFRPIGHVTVSSQSKHPHVNIFLHVSRPPVKLTNQRKTRCKQNFRTQELRGNNDAIYAVEKLFERAENCKRHVYFKSLLLKSSNVNIITDNSIITTFTLKMYTSNAVSLVVRASPSVFCIFFGKC